MTPRRFLPLLAVPALLLVGGGIAPHLRTAFEMPTAPPQTQAKAHGKAFNSLAQSLGKLDRKTLDAYIARWKTKPVTAQVAVTPPFFPPESQNPARALDADLSRASVLPAAPLERSVNVAPGSRASSTALATPFGKQTFVAPPRTLASASVAPSPTSSDATRAFLKSWAARQSLSRQDEAILGRRAVSERVALETRTPRETVDLSLVSPETQLELSNLRLQLLPLLSVPPAKRTQARAEIARIEARLREIWESETARQNELLRLALEEAPARARREANAALEQQTQQNARDDRARLAQVEREASTRARNERPDGSSLSLRQNAAPAPDETRVRAHLRAPFQIAAAPRQNVAPLGSNQVLARRTEGLSSPRLEELAQKQARLWRDATQ